MRYIYSTDNKHTKYIPNIERLKKSASAALLALLLFSLLSMTFAAFSLSPAFANLEEGTDSESVIEEESSEDNLTVYGLPDWKERPDERLLSRFVDFAGLLSESESEELTKKLDELSEKYDMDIVVVTTNTLEGLSPMEYADDFYDYYGYGAGDDFSGVLLLISMEDRDWWISTCGEGIRDFTDAGIKHIGERIVPALSDGNYYEAFLQFADLADDFINEARTNVPYDVDNMPKAPFEPPIFIALAAGFIIAGIIVSVFARQLKADANYAEPNKFIVEDSLNISLQNDTFLYHSVNKIHRPQTSSSGGSSTHTSSSGGTHGGGGGKF